MMEINLVGPFLMAKAFGSSTLREGRGSIVNVASVAGLVAVADRAAYNTSKHGLIGLTRTLAAEWGGRGVRVNAVCPGWVKTETTWPTRMAAVTPMLTLVGEFRWAASRVRTTLHARLRFLRTKMKARLLNGAALSVDGGWAADGSWESWRLRKR